MTGERKRGESHDEGGCLANVLPLESFNKRERSKGKKRATLQYSHYLAPESQRGRPCPHMSRDAFPRFFDSDEPEQRHRVLIEFGLCAGVALATDHHPLRACPFISSWFEHFLQTTSTGGFLAGSRFQFDAIFRPHPHAPTACCRSKCMHARVPPSIIHARTLSLVAYRPFVRVSLFVPQIPPILVPLGPTLTRLAASQTEWVPIVPDGYTKCEIRHGRIGSPLADGRTGQIGAGNGDSMFPASPPVRLLHLPRNGSLWTGVQRRWCYHSLRV